VIFKLNFVKYKKNSALKILVVDDDLDIVEILRYNIENQNSYFCLKIFFGK